MAEPVQSTAPPGQVGIVDQDGSVNYVAAENLQAARAEGARVASQEEIDAAAYRSGLAGAASTADALARGATFGLSDKIQVEGARLLGGDEAASQMAAKGRILRDEFADTTGAAEFAGGFLLPVPGGGAAKGLGGAAAKGLVGAAERTVGKGALTFALEHALPGAIAAGWDGAVMGAGQAMSESALGDHDLTAEKLVAGAEKGALFGAAIGGGLGFLGGALSRGGSRTGEALTRAAENKGEAAAARAEAAATRAEAVAGGGGASGVRGWLENQAEEQAFKATGAKIGDYQRLGSTAERQAERVSSIGRRLIDEGIVTPTASKTDIAERVASKLRATGEELGALRKQISETGATLDTNTFGRRVFEEVAAPLEAVPGSSKELNAVRGYMTDLLERTEQTGSIPLETAHEWRVALDKKLGYDKLGVQPATAELRKIRTILEDEWTKSADAAAKLKGDSFAEKYTLAKQAYADLATVNKIAGKEVAREGANRAISLTDTIAGATAFATMGPLGLAAAGANKLLRTYGNQLGATVLDKLSRLEGVQRATAQVDQAIGRAVSEVGTKGAGLRSPRVSSATAERVASQMLANPEAIQSRVSAFVGQSLGQVAPRTQEAVQSVAVRAATFLATKAPQSPPSVNTLQPRTETRKPTPADTAKFAKYIEAIDDPLIVVKGLRSGHVTREHVEAVQATYPKLFAVMQGRLAEEVGKLPRALPYPTRVALSVMFDVPLDASMRPEIVTGLQQQYAPAQKGPGPARRPLQIDAKTMAPASARIESGGA
jgi:hypothetical protein